MPRCYMVKKTLNKHSSRVNSWSEESQVVVEQTHRTSGPPSPTEGCSAPSSPEPTIYKPLETVTTSSEGYLEQYIPASCVYGEAEEKEELLSHDGGIPIFRLRSPEETEAAHDLLELSRSLPPLPAPSVARIALPSYRPHSPTTNEPDQATVEYVNYQHPCVPESPVSTASPLTPTTSEYSSDAENNPNPQNSDRLESKSNATSVIYTYDALLITDGRSRNNRKHVSNVPSPFSISPASDEESKDSNPAMKGDKYTCTECGKQYATSSNLSRHKQTHRSLDSQSAKKCLTCGKAYVSMPALAMHLLTHKLTHACGVCGKMFSRPWLLQGHLRSHTGEKPYGCAHCGKAFADRSNLRAHMQTHSSDKNYACSRCHKTFALKSYLNKHLESSCLKDGEEPIDEKSSPVVE